MFVLVVFLMPAASEVGVFVILFGLFTLAAGEVGMLMLPFCFLALAGSEIAMFRIFVMVFVFHLFLDIAFGMKANGRWQTNGWCKIARFAIDSSPMALLNTGYCYCLRPTGTAH
jgi:hypothetical protein